jgi:predicted phosphoribosyltransferase
MYFKSRVDAGQLLADEIVKKYQPVGRDCAVVALSDGGVMVGAQVALRLHCVLTMLLTEQIVLPREDAAVAGISQDGSFSYNSHYSSGEIDEFVSEYYHFIEQEKMLKMQEMHRQIGRAGLIRRDLVKEKNIILISDGLPDGFPLDIAAQFLKPIHYQKLIIATPLASVRAVDRMHVLADEIFCLSVVEDYISTDHYYDVQDVPTHKKVIETIEKIVQNWK